MVTNSPSHQVAAFPADCPTRQLLDRVADKWTVLVVLALSKDTLRFSRLQKQIEGISQKMLTQTLRHLERDGMLLRKVTPTVPVTVEYSLTPLGVSLVEVVRTMRRWVNTHYPEIRNFRLEYDQRVGAAP